MGKTVNRFWPSILLAVLGLLYLWIGLAAHGWDRLFGLAGGLLILTTTTTTTRTARTATAISQRSAATATGLLVLSALPLAIATWWSVVTPVLALLVLLIGLLAVRDTGGRRPGAARWVTTS